MPLTLDRRLQIQLRDSANRAIFESAFHQGKLPSNEVAWLRNFVEEAVPYIQAEWQHLFSGTGVTAHLSGFVCHGHPWVSFSGNPNSCELGDFLLVHDHEYSSGFVERQAALVQAKIFHDRAGVTARNALQLALYQGWPTFNYASWPNGMLALENLLRSKGLYTDPMSAYRRDLRHTATASAPTDAELDRGCRYGLIQVDYARKFYSSNYRRNPWRMSSANARPDVYTTLDGFRLGTYLARLVRGDAGRPAPQIAWPTSTSSACHWSLVVNELMTLKPAHQATTAAAHSLSAAVVQSQRKEHAGTALYGGGEKKPPSARAFEGEGGSGHLRQHSEVKLFPRSAALQLLPARLPCTWICNKPPPKMQWGAGRTARHSQKPIISLRKSRFRALQQASGFIIP